MFTIHSKILEADLIDPDDVRKASWDTLILILVIISILWLPFTFSFVTSIDYSLNIFELCLCCVFFIDIVVTFFTAVHVEDEGVYLLNHKEIANHYFRGHFFVDLLSSIPIDIIIGYVFNGIDLGVLKLVRLIRFVRLSKIIKVLKKYELNRFQTAALVGM